MLKCFSFKYKFTKEFTVLLKLWDVECDNAAINYFVLA